MPVNCTLNANAKYYIILKRHPEGDPYILGSITIIQPKSAFLRHKTHYPAHIQSGAVTVGSRTVLFVALKSNKLSFP